MPKKNKESLPEFPTNQHLGPVGITRRPGINVCTECGGKPVLAMDSKLMGYIHEINCPVMLKWRGESNGVDSGGWKLPQGNPRPGV